MKKKQEVAEDGYGLIQSVTLVDVIIPALNLN